MYKVMCKVTSHYGSISVADVHRNVRSYDTPLPWTQSFRPEILSNTMVTMVTESTFISTTHLCDVLVHGAYLSAFNLGKYPLIQQLNFGIFIK